jgi:flagellar assembly factor FliW
MTQPPPTGDVPIEDQVIVLPDGILGFNEHRNFVLVELVEDGAFQQLQSLDDPDFSMIVTVPWLFVPEYAPVLSEAEQDQLEISDPQEAIVFCPVTFDADANRAFVNLLGPFVINAASRRGRQLVLTGTDYSARTPLELVIS